MSNQVKISLEAANRLHAWFKNRMENNGDKPFPFADKELSEILVVMSAKITRDISKTLGICFCPSCAKDMVRSLTLLEFITVSLHDPEVQKTVKRIVQIGEE